MISPELLRRYPFFSFLNESERKAIAMISDEIEARDGDEILKAGQIADYLYFMTTGNGSNFFIVDEREGYKQLYAGEINPGELFGVSALLEPYTYTTSIHANGEVKAIRIDAKSLRAAFELDNKLGLNFMTALSQALMSRLNDARAQISVSK